MTFLEPAYKLDTAGVPRSTTSEMSDLNSYTSSVPACLHPVNGKAVDAADPNLESVAQRLLEELRLVRERRLLFIGYKRSEVCCFMIRLGCCLESPNIWAG